MGGVEFGGGDDLGKLLHVSWLDVDDVEADAAVVEVPEVDAEIVRGDECFLVRVDRDGVDVVCVRVGKDAAGVCHDEGPCLFDEREAHIHRDLAARVCLGGGGAGAGVEMREEGVGRELRDGAGLCLLDAPQLDGLVVRGDDAVRGVDLADPADLVDFLLDLHGLEVVELGLVRLELCPEAELRGVREACGGRGVGVVGVLRVGVV
mmetsp:Transcript_4467/g.11561  ORF Transcript_4467/g.11561 Transcript_4467/m.11561 type:complete len:206 (+) Transcript_4467:808-1425(+)